MAEKRRFKHGTKVRFKLTSGARVIEDTIMPIDQMGGHVTLVSIMYNRLSVSGGTSWWDPSTGAPIATPKWAWDLVDPTDELTGDALCDCPDCQEEA